MAQDDHSSGRDAGKAVGMKGRSPLYQWLWDRYNDLDSARQRVGKASWSAVAKLANEDGIRTRDGRAVDRHLVRSTFLKVDHAVRLSGRQPTPPPLPDLAPEEPDFTPTFKVSIKRKEPEDHGG
jgi:hypothetical protein